MSFHLVVSTRLKASGLLPFKLGRNRSSLVLEHVSVRFGRHRYGCPVSKTNSRKSDLSTFSDQMWRVQVPIIEPFPQVELHEVLYRT